MKLPKQRALTTPYVIDALSDKASSVRRYAIATLTNMILTHPFGTLYGGFLNQPEWEARYQQVKKEIKRIEAKQMGAVPGADAPLPAEEEAEEDAEENEADEDPEGADAEEQEVDEDGEPIPRKKKSKKKAKRVSNAPPPNDQALDADDMANFTRLKLTKRYIADALEFIRGVEGSMDVLGQLLGSTSKAEVLESIEFFKVAYEYQMAGASVSSMIRSHLKCYCLTRFFVTVGRQEDAALDLDERQQRHYLRRRQGTEGYSLEAHRVLSCSVLRPHRRRRAATADKSHHQEHDRVSCAVADP